MTSIYPASVTNANIITIWQGADFLLTLTIVDDDTGEPIPDFVDYDIAASLRKLDGTSAATFTAAITGATTATLALTDTVTDALTAATSVQHVWGIKLTKPDGTELPEAQGGAMVRVRVVA